MYPGRTNIVTDLSREDRNLFRVSQSGPVSLTVFGPSYTYTQKTLSIQPLNPECKCTSLIDGCELYTLTPFNNLI